MKGVQEDWRSREMGFALGRRTEQILCNLRFADDLIIFASSAEQLHTMVEELAGAVYKFGLEIHFGKTKILSNVRDEERGGRKSFEVKGKTVEYVSYGGSVEYLGRLFSFGDLHEAEMAHRIRKGWGKFMGNKDILCNNVFPLGDRLRLWEATVTATVLYGSDAWTMTKNRKKV